MTVTRTANGLFHAQDFLVAAESVLKRTAGVFLPAYFLLGLSIELSVKALLITRGLILAKLS